MFTKYLVTGATGFLGRAVIQELKEKQAEIRALVLPGDPLMHDLPRKINVVYGNVCDYLSLHSFFSGADANTCVIHCAGIVSVASRPGCQIYRVNVNGTNNILKYCKNTGTGKMVYVSSVHAIPENPDGKEISEPEELSPGLVHGAYAKSKALAADLVMKEAENGLNASVVFPSGIIGPGDLGNGSITHMLSSFLDGKLPIALNGGYDFVDVRDVAAGIVSCTERGRPGQGYILSGEYVSIREILNTAKDAIHLSHRVVFLPLLPAKIISRFYEKRSLKKQEPLFFTPYAVSVLSSNSRFSKIKAETELGYSSRSIGLSIRDTALWLQDYICR